MKILHPNTPKNLSARAQQELVSALGRGPIRDEFFGPGDLEGVHLSQAHRSYELLPEGNLRDGWLANSKAAGWRMLALQQHREPFAIEFDPGLEKASFNKGPLAAGTVECMQHLDEFGAVADKDFELRLLRLPSMHVAFVWLAREGEDYLVSILDSPTPFERMVPIPPDDLVESLNWLGKQVMTSPAQMDDEPL